QAAPAVVVAGLAAVLHPAAGVGQGLLQGGPGGVVVFGLQGQVSGVDDLVPGYGHLRAAGAAGRTRRPAVFRRVHTVLGRGRRLVPLPAPAGPIGVITWLPTTATAAQAAMPAAHRRQWGKRTALPFWAGAGLLVCSWDFGVSGCMASRRAFSSSGA